MSPLVKISAILIAALILYSIVVLALLVPPMIAYVVFDVPWCESVKYIAVIPLAIVTCLVLFAGADWWTRHG